MAAAALNHCIPTQRFLPPPPTPRQSSVTIAPRLHHPFPSELSINNNPSYKSQTRNSRTISCLDNSNSSSSPPRTSFNPSTRLFVSGLSFRTTKESLTNAFKNFGELVEVNLVMDRIANRPRGFAFLRYTTEEEAKKAIEGMHGKFLDGRVIFVEIAKSRAQLRQEFKQNPR